MIQKLHVFQVNSEEVRSSALAALPWLWSSRPARHPASFTELGVCVGGVLFRVGRRQAIGPLSWQLTSFSLFCTQCVYKKEVRDFIGKIMMILLWPYFSK